MTTLQILRAIRSKVLEATSDLLEDSVLLLYVNLAYQDVIKRTFSNDQITSATVSFSSGVGTLPTNFGTLAGDAFDSAGNFYPELNIQDFKKEIQERGVTIEGGQIKVLPTTVSSLTIKFYPSYADLTSAVNPTINSYFHELLVYGGMYRALEDLQDEVLSKYYREKFESELGLKLQAMSMYEEGNQNSGQLFNGGSLISDGSNSGSFF